MLLASALMLLQVLFFPALAAAAGPLSGAEVQALHLALDDEYRAWTTYGQVISDLGAIRPFTNIQPAEAQHISALVTLFKRYGLAVPPNPYPGLVPNFSNKRSACSTGVQAELANVALYDRLLPITAHTDLLNVFTSLRSASLYNHLPAFERCAG